MDFVRSTYFDRNEPLTSWTLLSSVFSRSWSVVHFYQSNFLQNPYFRVPERKSRLTKITLGSAISCMCFGKKWEMEHSCNFSQCLFGYCFHPSISRLIHTLTNFFRTTKKKSNYFWPINFCLTFLVTQLG